MNDNILVDVQMNVEHYLETAEKNGNEAITEQDLIDAVHKFAHLQAQMHGEQVTNEDVAVITKRIEQTRDINVTLSQFVEDKKRYTPWLPKRRQDGMASYYADRYFRHLKKKGIIKGDPLAKMEDITDQILDRLGNPEDETIWKRKGLVVGHVQSGKTANYTALTCKAADAGYRVIVILAGMLNSLRRQTQQRIDEGFIGMDSSRMLESNLLPANNLIGVGKISHQRLPVTFTTQDGDFSKATASKIRAHLGALNEPLVLVIKKNSSILKNLSTWLREYNIEGLDDFPMLLVDDEADHASINTKKDVDEATAVNKGIRNLLSLFKRSSYVGYTATPFANIFINPDTRDDMFGDDLFPEDFILSLGAPDNYVGPKRVFSDESDLNIVRPVNDNKDLLPVKHKIEFDPIALPKSLKEAIRCFIIARALRILRRQSEEHNSMMVNVSRFTRIQSKIRTLILDYIALLRVAVTNYSRLSEQEALEDSVIRSLKDTWEKEYLSEFSWPAVQRHLIDAIRPIEVIEVNSSPSAQQLNYGKDYPKGRNVIAVGGLTLSRGLTLEGLTVSYFLRNSVMYDTLMQMGRWFGYRDGYGDLCRIYMTDGAQSWYSHISDVLTEIREEFHRMKMADMTPRDYGLCVRCHPESLIVTARNKMRSSKTVTRAISLAGRVIESSTLLNEHNIFTQNRRSLETVIGKAEQEGTRVSDGKDRYLKRGSFFWSRVPKSVVTEFVNGFKNHPGCIKMHKTPVLDYIDKAKLDTWDVILVGLNKSNSRDIEVIPGISVIPESRKSAKIGIEDREIRFSQRKVAQGVAEKIGLSHAVLAEHPDASTDGDFRQIRNRPLLILHLVDIKQDIDGGYNAPVVAYGLSFPGTPNSGATVEYQVNTTWWRTQSEQYVEEEKEYGYESE